jgi:hypothetical protein
MQVSKPIQRAALVAASALALATLAIAPPASAAPVFTDADTHLDPFGEYSSSGPAACTVVGVNDANPDVPMVENGPAASAAASSSATFANTGTPSDTGTWAAQSTATGKVTSIGGNVNTLDFASQGSFSLANALGTSASCYRGGYAGVSFDFTFTVTQAGFLHLNFKNAGAFSYGEVYIYQDLPSGQYPYLYHYGESSKFNDNTTVLLPPGTYKGDFEGESYVESRFSSTAGNVSTSVHGQFSVAGAQTAPVTGKAKKYVTLPAARSCATHSINASVIGKRKRADQVKQVNVFVNDAKVKKVKTPDKGDAVTIPVADDVAAEVRAEVTLFPRKKGKPGKVVKVTASYEACS